MEKALLIRAVEQRLLSLFAEGKLFGTVHTCIGQELTGVAVARELQQGDQIFSNHRCHGHFIALTDNVDGLVAEIMGKQSGVCGGRGGSQHLCSKGFFSNGIQGGIMPVAAGFALAQQIQKQKKIVVIFIGDGTLGEGAVYESMNIASKWNLPLLIVLENNQYSQSTAQNETLAGDIQARARAFNIQTACCDTWNLNELLATTARATDFVREQSRPFFLQINTYRLMAHSKGDDDRDQNEIKSYWERDPLTIYQTQHPETTDRILSQQKQRIDTAVTLGEQASYAQPEIRNTAPDSSPISWAPTRIESRERSVTLIRDSLRRNMATNDRIILLGEDIRSPYGGAFKVTKGLSDEFPDRVRNTPIAESLIVGLGNGLALGGMLPVCEIMFGDFLTLACDQIVNHASKFPYMYNDQVKVPLIVRTPMGGKRGYGPTHSQSIEKMFLGLPQTRILSLHSRYDPGLVYDALFATINRPTLVIENKLLYAVRVSDEMPAGFLLEHSNQQFPTTRIRVQGPADVTVVCYGGILPDVEVAIQNAFDQHEIICEVICPMQLYPLDLRPILESVSQTGRLLVVEEGIGFAAFGAEVLAQLTECNPGAIKRARRLGSPEHPVPSCGPLEKSVLPNPGSILNAIVETLQHV